MDAPFYILINSVQVLHTHISKIFVVFFLDNSHPDRCKVTLHCGFDLHFPDEQSCWAHFHVPFVYVWWPFVCLLWRNVYSSPSPIFKLRYLIFLENLGIPDTINCTYQSVVFAKFDAYLRETITTVKSMNTSFAPKFPSCPLLVIPFCSFLSPQPPKELLIYFLSPQISLHFLEFFMSGIIQYALLFCITSFRQQQYFEIHRCHCVHQYEFRNY